MTFRLGTTWNQSLITCKYLRAIVQQAKETHRDMCGSIYGLIFGSMGNDKGVVWFSERSGRRTLSGIYFLFSFWSDRFWRPTHVMRSENISLTIVCTLIMSLDALARSFFIQRWIGNKFANLPWIGFGSRPLYGFCLFCSVCVSGEVKSYVGAIASTQNWSYGTTNAPNTQSKSNAV